MTAVLQFLESFDVVLLGLMAFPIIYWADPIKRSGDADV